MNISRRIVGLSLTGLVLAAVAGSPAQAQIQNGSFEQGTFVNNGSGADALSVGSTAIASWTTTNAELAWAINGNPYGLTTPYGSYFLDLTGYHDSVPYGGVTQTIATTSGTLYHLSFSLGTDQDKSIYAGPVGVMASAEAVSQTFTFTPPNGSTGNQWGTFGLDFTATGASTSITITGALATGGQYIGLDNVSVTSAPVPEASTTISLGLLLILGMGGLVVAAKRKKSANQA